VGVDAELVNAVESGVNIAVDVWCVIEGIDCGIEECKDVESRTVVGGCLERIVVMDSLVGSS
jgi:hypothetical protein